MRNKRLQPYLDFLASKEVDAVDVSITRSNHYKMIVTSQGKRGIFIVPSSTSDRRSFLNWKSDVKKWMQACHA